MSAELARYLAFAQQTAYDAGRLTLGYYYRSLEIIAKGDGSPVTEADRAAERLIRGAIEKGFPDHGIHGEEYGVKDPAPGCSWRWFIDPIDGTKSFIHGIPFYSNLLGLVHEERSVVGIINLPALGEMVAAAKGLGCALNGRPVRVSQVAELSKAVVLTTDRDDLQRTHPDGRWKPLFEGCKFARTWGDAYGYALVATGRAEIMLDARVEAYDVAPLPVILGEAGGAFYAWDGKETIFGGNGAASNEALAGTVKGALGG